MDLIVAQASVASLVQCCIITCFGKMSIKLLNQRRRDAIKDARSVSLYPYNLSQILQYVKYTK